MSGEPFRFFWRFPSDAGAFSASNTASGFDVDNLKRSTLDKKWRSDEFGSALVETVTVDLGSAQAITAFVLLDHDLIDTDVLVLRFASDSGFTTDVGTVAITFRENTLVEFFAAVTRQYWRLEITALLDTAVRQAGRLLLGPHYEMERSLALGYTVGPGQDTGKTIRTQGGQLYGDLGVRLKMLGGEFVAMQEADNVEVDALKNANGKSVPLFVAMDWTNFPLKKSLYGTLTQVGSSINIGVERWSFPLRMLEQK